MPAESPDPVDYPVVDADVHIYEDPQAMARYADGTLKHTLEIYRGPQNWLDTPGYSPLTVYEPPLGEDPHREPHTVRSRDALRADLDALGVDAAVMFTGRFLGVPMRPDPVYPVGITRVYNRYLREEWLDPGRGLYGAIMTVPQDPGVSAREIERHADHPGFAAVYLPTAGTFPLWGHRQYDPVYAAAEAAGLPVVLQGYTVVYPAFPYQLDHVESALAKQVLAQPFGAMANLVTMATTGVFAKFPRLKVVFTECGVAWLPAVLWRLDHQRRFLRHEVPFHDGPFAAALRGRLFATLHSPESADDPAALAALLAAAGLEDAALFASDWPHYDADRPARLLDMPIAPTLKRKLLSDNARRAFRLTGL